MWWVIGYIVIAIGVGCGMERANGGRSDLGDVFASLLWPVIIVCGLAIEIRYRWHQRRGA